MNMFEQVSSLGHQMSRAGGQGPVQKRALYGEVQCIMGNGHMGPAPPSRTKHNEWKTPVETLPSRNFIAKR